jgi:hypothetical protein
VRSDWVISEAERAARAGKLVPVRLAGLDPIDIPPPFGTRHTTTADDRAGILAALRTLGVGPSKRDQRSPPATRAPVASMTADDASKPASWSNLGSAAAWIAGVAAALFAIVMAINSYSQPKPKVRGISEHKVFTPGGAAR